MVYMGSKNRIAKEILPIILKDRVKGQWYVEPFVGGCNMIDKVGNGNDNKRLAVYLDMPTMNTTQWLDILLRDVDKKIQKIDDNLYVVDDKKIEFTDIEYSQVFE